MQCFKDSTGQAWDINITIGTRELIRTRCGFDFVAESGAGAEDLIKSLIFDLEKFVDLLFVVLEKQRVALKIEPQELADRLDGATLDSAQTAMLAAFCDFFHQSRRCHRSTALRETMATAEKMLTLAEAEAVTRSRQVQSLIDTCGSLRELSESFPTISHTGNSGGSTSVACETSGTTPHS